MSGFPYEQYSDWITICFAVHWISTLLQKSFLPQLQKMLESFQSFFSKSFGLILWDVEGCECSIFVGDFHVSPSLGSLFGCPEFLIWKNRRKWIFLFYWGWLVCSPNGCCLYNEKSHLSLGYLIKMQKTQHNTIKVHQIVVLLWIFISQMYMATHLN